MSYSSLPSYGNYYESTTQNESQSQSMQNTYNKGGQTSERYRNQATYPGNVRQSQYGSLGYDWSGQNQLPSSTNPSQRRVDDSSRIDANAQRSTYGDSSQSSAHEPQSSLVTAKQGNYRTHPSSQTTQGSNSLIYASSLSDSGSQRQESRTQQPSLSSGSVHAGANGPGRALSPATQNNVRHQKSNPPSGYGSQNESATIPSQSPYMSAAATALAGAVSRRYSQASDSPVSEALKAVPNGVAQKPVSPLYQSNLPQSQRRPSFHAHEIPQPSHSNNERSGRQEMPQDQGRQHARAPSQGVVPSPTQLRQPRPQDNSISKLATHSTEEYSLPQYSATMDPQNVMPNYVDPAQVFNPYAREHERRRRAAEEAAKRKTEEEVAAARKTEEEAAAAKMREEEAAVASAAKQRLMDQVAKKKPAVSAKAKATNSKMKPKQAAPPTPSQSISTEGSVQTELTTEASESDMAAELKAMMEKMKEFRTKDPALFQKLWDDVRKPAASVQPATPSPQLAQAAGACPRPNVPIPDLTDEQTPAPTAIPLNGHKIVVENNPEALPDLGRFPPERGIPASYNAKKGANAVRGTPDALKLAPVPIAASQVTPPAGLPPAGDHADAPVHAQPAPAPVSAPPSHALSTKSPVLTQGLSPRMADGGTVWPEDKRNALAEAALKALKSNPANDEIEITLADIHAILERNPSYIDLCELLERKGFKFHRGQFARQLLSKVPRLNESQQKGSPSPSQAQLHALPRQQIPPTRTTMPITAPAAPSLGTAQPRIPDPIAGPIPPPTGFQPTHQTNGHPINAAAPPGAMRHLAPQFYHGPPSGGPMYRPSPPLGPPARPVRPESSALMKMTRREPPQGTKEAMARKRDFSEIVDLTALSDHEDYVLSRKQARVASTSPEHDPFEEYQKIQMSSIAPSPAISQPQGPPTTWSMTTATAPVKFNPNEMPQQGLGRGTAQSSTAPTPASTTIKSYKALAKQINKNEALKKTYYNPKTVARDILIAAGRHPTERPLNAHMAGLLGKLIDIDSDLNTFDWDAIDPGGPDVPQVASVEIPMEPPRYQLGQYVKRPGKTPEPRLPDLDKRDQPALGDETVPQQQGQHFTSSGDSHERLHHESNSSSLAPPSHRQHDSDKVTLNRRRRDSSVVSAVQSSGQRRSVRSSSIRAEDNANPVPKMAVSTFPSGKKRGRPFGSKNTQPGVAALKAAANPPPQISVTVPSQSTNPKFRCRWRRCGATLHNLETLRHHVHKVHCPSAAEIQENGYVCWWRRCRYLVEDSSGLVTASKSFDDAKAWFKHVEEDHLYNVALRHGDGPSTKHIDYRPG